MKTVTKTGTVILILMLIPWTVFADVVTKTTTTTITIRPETPLYTGIVETDAFLEPLTLEEFQSFGTKPAAAFQQYQEYKEKIEHPTPDTGALLYKMKVYRPLTIADFEGEGISPEVAKVRYSAYVRAVPVMEGNRPARYVYVYHKPV